MTNSSDVALAMPADLYEGAVQALAKYIVFSKAEITNLSEHYCGIGLQGAEADALIATYFGQTPPNQNALVHKDQSFAINLGHERFECWLPTEDAIKFWRAAAAQCQIGSAEQWTLSNIADGIPEIHPETADTFIPQMLNLQLTGGVSFNKGCYTGQEVVARMEFRGKLKRPMYRISFPLAEGEALPEPGAPLYKLEKDQSIGNIVMAARKDKEQGEALAVLTRSEAEADNAYLDLNKTKKLGILKLPYAINAEEEF
jgi:folate-binding protein YgfZ